MKTIEKEPIKINGRYYPLWSQFVHRKDEFIGRKLQDFGDPMDKALGLTDGSGATTEITDIKLESAGKEGAMFTVEGKEFSCAFNVAYGGITGGEEGWLTFHGYGGHEWRIENAKAQSDFHRSSPLEGRKSL